MNFNQDKTKALLALPRAYLALYGLHQAGSDDWEVLEAYEEVTTLLQNLGLTTDLQEAVDLAYSDCLEQEMVPIGQLLAEATDGDINLKLLAEIAVQATWYVEDIE